MELLMVHNHNYTFRVTDIDALFFFLLVGADYNAVSEILTFDTGTSRACIFISAVDDQFFEDDEEYSLNLTFDAPGLTLDPEVATVIIPNDDECELTVVSFAQPLMFFAFLQPLLFVYLSPRLLSPKEIVLLLKSVLEYSMEC